MQPVTSRTGATVCRMKNRALSFTLLLGLSGQDAWGTPPDVATEPAPVLFRAPSRTLCLSDGLRLRTHSLAGTPLARVQVSIDIGADRDLAHLAAQLWLRSHATPPEPEPASDAPAPADDAPAPIIAAPPPPPPSVHQQLQALGIRHTITDGPDLLTISLVAPPTLLPDLLAIQGRQLTDPLANLTDADLAVARRDVEAARLDPDTMLWRGAAAALYPAAHPYNPSLGDLSSHSLSAVQDYAQRAFSPAGLMMTVTADFSAFPSPKDSIQRAIAGDTAGFFPAPADADAASAPATEMPSGPARVFIADDSCVAALPSDPSLAVDRPAQAQASVRAQVSDPEALLVWPLPGAYTDDDLTWEMFAVITEDLLSTALGKKGPPGLLPSERASCAFLPGVHASALTCRVPVDRDGSQSAVKRKAIDGNDVMWFPDALSNLKEHLPDFRQRLRGRILLRAADSIDGELSAQSWESSYDRVVGDTYPHASRMSALDDLDPKTVLASYREWMNPERLALVSVVPTGTPPDLSADPFHSGLMLTGSWAPVPPPWEPPAPQPPPEEENARAEDTSEDVDTEVVEPLSANALAELASSPVLSGLTRETLSNGMGLVVATRPGYPVVRATLIHEGGVLRSDTPVLDEAAWLTMSPFGQPEEAAFVPTWPLEGLATWHRERLPGAWVSGLTGPAGNMEGLLYILRESVRPVEGDTRNMRAYPNTGRQYRPDAWRSLRLASYDAFYGTSAPAGEPYISRSERKAVTLEQAQAAARTIITPARTTLLVISPIPADEIRAAAEATFSDWSAAGTTRAPARPSPSPRQAVLLMDGPGSIAEVQMRCPLGSTDANVPAARSLLADMLSLSAWEAMRASPPTGFSLHVEEMGGGVAWLRTHYTAPAGEAGAAVASYRTLLSETLAMLEEQIALAELDKSRLSLLEGLTEALEAQPRPPRRERKRLAALIEALEALPEQVLPSEELEPVLAELSSLIEAGEALPEPEEAPDDAEAPELVAVPYIPAPRPTLDDARARRARLQASAYGSPSALLSQIVAEQAYGLPAPRPVALGRALAAVDTVALRDQLQACVGHDLVSVYAPVEQATPSLQGAGLSFEVLEAKAYRKR